MDFDKLKQDIQAAIQEENKYQRLGEDVHSKLLTILVEDIKDSWDESDEALDEVLFVVNKVFKTQYKVYKTPK